MTRERFQRVCELFERAVSLSGLERQEFLSRIDPSLRADVEKMLQCDEKNVADHFLEQPFSADDSQSSHANPDPPEQAVSFICGPIDGYRCIKKVSCGGQGVVYEALQESTQRRVAIKVLRDGRSGRALVFFIWVFFG